MITLGSLAAFLGGALPGATVVATETGTIPELAPGAVAVLPDAGQEDPPGTWSTVVRLAPARAHDRARLVATIAPPSAGAIAELAALDERRRRERSFDTVGPQTGGLLYLLAVVGRARRVLDVGTGDGASALWLAAAMARTRGELVAVERDSARATAARAILRRAGLEGRVTFHLGDWERVRHRLGDGFGLALLDTDPLDRPAQFQPLVDRCAPGALVASRGMLDHAAELARYQALVRTHPSVAADIALGADDGLALALLRPSSRGAQARSAGG